MPPIIHIALHGIQADSRSDQDGPVVLRPLLHHQPTGCHRTPCSYRPSLHLEIYLSSELIHEVVPEHMYPYPGHL